MKDKIIEKLSNESKGLSLIEINDLLNLTSVEDYKELQKNMDALVTEGIVHKSKKDKFILMEKCSSLLTGIIHINKHGNGFVDTKFDEDTFVKRENLNGAVDGDFVEIDVQNDKCLYAGIDLDGSLATQENIEKYFNVVLEIDPNAKLLKVLTTPNGKWILCTYFDNLKFFKRCEELGYEYVGAGAGAGIPLYSNLDLSKIKAGK